MSMMARSKMQFDMGGLTGSLPDGPRLSPSPTMQGPINTGAKRPGLFNRVGNRMMDKFKSPDFLNNLSQRLRRPSMMGGGIGGMNNMGGGAVPRPQMFQQRPQMTRPMPQNNQPQMRRAMGAWMNF